MITITIIIPASSILHWCLFSSTGGLRLWWERNGSRVCFEKCCRDVPKPTIHPKKENLWLGLVTTTNFLTVSLQYPSIIFNFCWVKLVRQPVPSWGPNIWGQNEVAAAKGMPGWSRAKTHADWCVSWQQTADIILSTMIHPSHYHQLWFWKTLKPQIPVKSSESYNKKSSCSEAGVGKHVFFRSAKGA